MYRWFVSAATLAVATALYFLHVRLTSADLPFYRKLVQESIDLHAHSALEKSPVRQTRKGVRKDIWTIQDGTRQHIQIESLQSDMTLKQKKGKMEAVEHLQGIEAWIDLGKERRHLTAESGTCYFPSCEIEALHLATGLQKAHCFAKETRFAKDTVELTGSFHVEHPAGRLFGEQGTLTKGSNRFECGEGVLFEAARTPFSISSMRAAALLPSKSSHSGLFAEEIYFSDGVEIQTVSGIRALGNSATLKESSLQLLPVPGSTAAMIHERGQIDAKEILFDRTSNELLCLMPHGVFQEGRTLFDADTGRAQFLGNRFHPDKLLLEGNVRIASYLQEKESCAKADSATIYLSPKKMVLESAPLSRVLFRQEGLEISAPTVHIQEAIQGFGDVRFFFYPEEKTVLDTLFMKIYDHF